VLYGLRRLAAEVYVQGLGALTGTVGEVHSCHTAVLAVGSPHSPGCCGIAVLGMPYQLAVVLI
jgi:hypothetical protein